MIRVHVGTVLAWAECPDRLTAFRLSGILSEVSGRTATTHADRVTVSIYNPHGITTEQQREWIDEAIRRLQEWNNA